MRVKSSAAVLIIFTVCFVVQPANAIPQTPITIKDFAFQPPTATEEAGVPITWTNTDAADHTVTFDTINIDSGDIPADGTFSTTIATPGTYTYHCAIHSSMKGTITVVSQQPPPTLTPRAWLPLVKRSPN